MEDDSTYGQVIQLLRRKPVLSQDKSDPSVLPSLTDLLIQTCADPAATAFMLAKLAHITRPIMWVQDHASRRDNGHIYAPGLAGLGMRQPVLQVHVSHARDVLWAMEEGAGCAGLSAIIGEVYGAPSVLSFTATKRLVMRADASGVPVFLIRSGDPGVLSAARDRWRITSLPSQPNPHDPQAPGNPQWDLDLFRAKGRSPGRWVACYDPDASRTADRLCLVSRTDDGAMEAGDQPIPHATQ